MGGESTTRTVPRGGGANRNPVGSRTGHRLSNIAVALGLVLFLGGFAWGAVVYRPYTVPTGSMAPTIDVGDRVVAQRIDGADVRRGDVVVFKDANWADAPMVKRVVAVGGDTVSCCQQGRLKVNGKVIEEPYLPAGAPAEDSDFQTVTVPEGRLFLLGDERHNSVDSTAHIADAAAGTVARGAVDARVDAVVWPMDGMLERPTGFETLGALSSPGPLRTVVALVIAGVVLILGGAAYGPVAKWRGASRTRSGAEPTGGR
ncbi:MULTISPECIES: signal peptidase I [unclassified Streptomyces]|uniref:signal peptidase I n=1 Tax=unclassified Streptomyces TaxID=2593676 RepID=UPI002E28CE9D|nr:signal peptidase I [Streptomyces sp. NBC_00334]